MIPIHLFGKAIEKADKMSAAVEWRTLIVLESLVSEGPLSPPTLTTIRLMVVTALCCPELKLHLLTT